MPRHAKIDVHGLGDKVLAYAGDNTPVSEIVRRVNQEHPAAHLTAHNVEDYLAKKASLLIIRRNETVNNQITMTLGFVQSTLLETVGEIRTYLAEYKDDPRHAAAFLKLKLDAIEKMTKMLGGYPSERPPTVNVQVNNVFTKDALEKSLVEAEDYFKTMDVEATENGL